MNRVVADGELNWTLMLLTGLRVLIVEDEPIIALDLAMTFRDAGAVPIAAVSEKHALDIIASGRVDLATVDVGVWEGKSSELIASMLTANRVPFVVVSAYRRSHPGAIGHVQKPNSGLEAMKLFEAYLNKHPRGD
jgi:CheY-like chemotaxis protein